MKDVAKKPLTPLKELPQRYWAWQQAGGVRASIAGYDNLAQDDDFDEEVEGWEFDEDVSIKHVFDCLPWFDTN